MMNGSSLTPNRRIVFAAGVAVLASVALAFATAASGTATNDARKIAQLQRQVAALQTEVRAHAQPHRQIERVSVSSRIAYIDAVGLHGMETRYQTAGLTTRDLELLGNALVLARALPWPAALRDDALDLRKDLERLIAANKAGNKAAEFEALKAAHEQGHVLSYAAYKWLGR
jgi:hypothetical protein